MGQRIIAAIRHDAALEALLSDSTIVRAHQHAAGAPKKTARKIHLTGDALGNPLRGLLTGGEVADIPQAQTWIEGLHAQAVIGDTGYDAEALVASSQAMGAEAVIPPRSTRTEPRA